jgi:hypothetical protein
MSTPRKKLQLIDLLKSSARFGLRGSDASDFFLDFLMETERLILF